MEDMKMLSHLPRIPITNLIAQMKLLKKLLTEFLNSSFAQISARIHLKERSKQWTLSTTWEDQEMPDCSTISCCLFQIKIAP